MQFTIPATTADGLCEVTPPTDVRDAEGNVITEGSGFKVELRSSDESVLSFQPGAEDTPNMRPYHVGAPGTCAVTAVAVFDNGVEFVFASAAFNVHAGPPVQVTGGGIAFSGITPDPETPVA